MLTITIQPGDLKGEFLAGLSPLVDAVIEESLDKSAASILNSLRRTFLAEQDPSGQAWVPSAAGRKRRAKGGTGTLFDTGRLFRSIQLSSSTPGERVISTDVPYGPGLQSGLTEYGLRLPPRPFLLITPVMEDRAISTFQAQLKRAIKESIT